MNLITKDAIQRLRWIGLGSAWAVVLVSVLLLPGLRFTGNGWRIPMWLYLALGSERYEYDEIWLEQFAYWGLFFLLISPLLGFLRWWRNFFTPTAMLLSAGLLLPWVIPIYRWACPEAIRRSSYSDSRLLWGYFVFAGGHTLAFFSCLIGPPSKKPEKDKKTRGFPVSPPPGKSWSDVPDRDSQIASALEDMTDDRQIR